MMNIQRRSLVKITLFAVSLAIIPATALAKKGGNGGGGKPGGGGGGDDGGGGGDVALLTEEPSLLYTSTLDLSSGEAIVFSNEDGTAKKTFLTGSYLSRRAKFIPGKSAIVYLNRDSSSSSYTINRQDYAIDPVDGPVPVGGPAILDQMSGGTPHTHVSPDGSWVLYRNNSSDDPDDTIRIQRTYPTFGEAARIIQVTNFDGALYSHPFIWDAVWLSNTRIAVSYAGHNADGSPDYHEVAVYDLDPNNMPTGPLIPFMAYRIPNNEDVRPTPYMDTVPNLPSGFEGIAYTVRAWTGETRKSRGQVSKVYEIITYRMVFDLANPEQENTLFEPLSPVVLGWNPEYSPDGQFLLTAVELGRLAEEFIVRTTTDSSVPEADREIVIEDRGISRDPDWNPDWVANP